METVKLQRTLAAAPDKVYAYLLDLMNDTNWQDNIVSTALESGEAGTVGAKYKRSVQSPMGKMANNFTIAELEPGRLITHNVDGGPLKLTLRTTLEPNGDGTLITQEVSSESPMFKMAKGMIEPQMKKALEKLDGVLQALS